MTGKDRSVVMLLTNAFISDPRVYKEARSLINNGYKVTVLAWDKSAVHPEKENIEGIEVERIHSLPTRGSAKKNLLYLPLLWINIVFRLWRRDFDYIHCHDFDTLPCGFLAGKIKRKKIIYDRHEYYGNMIACNRNIAVSPGKRRLIVKLLNKTENYLAARVDRVIVIDHVMAAEFPGLSGKVKIVPNLPELSFFLGSGGRREKKKSTVLLSVGLFRAVRESIEAAGMAVRETGDLKLVFVGTVVSPRHKRDLADLLAREPYRSLVRIEKEVPRKEIPRYMAGADIGLALFDPEVYPPNTVFQNNKIFEYLGFGLPVIASGFRHYDEEFVSRRCCLIVDSIDPEKIARAITYLVKNPEIAREMGERGRRAVRERFNWNTSEENLLRAYRSLES